MKKTETTILDLNLKINANLWFALQEIIQLAVSNDDEDKRLNEDIAWQKDELHQLTTNLVEEAIKHYLAQFININESVWGKTQTFSFIQANYDDYIQESKGNTK